ncbi:MFS general substrate transporter [Aspergillus crustosus]
MYLDLPADAWDTHIHCFDPAHYPFRPGRTYTPPAALLKSFLYQTTVRHVMLVQASVENGYHGLIETLSDCHRQYPDVVIRGTIARQDDWDMLSKTTFDSLHTLGVRSIRVHGFYGGSGDNLNAILVLFRSLSRSYPVESLKWTISAQLPLKTWAALKDALLTDSRLSHLQLVADHNGCATPTDIGSHELDAFMELLRSNKVSVKISALYRRSPENIQAMQPIIQAFANTAPNALLWGSDWPHCDTTAGGHDHPPLRGPAEVGKELQLLQKWLTTDQWRKMLVDNPRGTSPGPRVTKEAWVEDPNHQHASPVMATYHAYDEDFAKTTEAQLRRKIDVRILPLVVLVYLFNYLDRNSITQARLYGLQEDTGLKGAQYQTAISIFSAGYIVMQIPSAILMTKLRPSLYLPCCIIVWAIVSGCTAAVTNPAGMLVLRLILGLVEAPFFPGAIFYLSCWYTKRELGVRMALLICGLLLSNAFAGLISAGILSGMDGVGDLAAWRWLFILEGMATVLLGLLAMAVLPDFPGTTKWLSEAERVVAQARLAVDAGSADLLDEEKVPITRGIGRALRDYRVWLFACLQMATTASISYSHFFPTLIQEIGFENNTIVLLLTSPPYLFAFCWALGFAWSADRLQVRSPQAGFSQVVAIIGSVLLIAIPQRLQWARYVFTFLICAGTFGVYSTTYTWLSSTIAQPPIKRAAAIGIANTCANLASLYANYFWLDQYGPTFRVSWGCILGFQVLGLCCILALRYALRRSNRRFERLAAEVDVHDTVAVDALDDDARRAVVSNFRYIT